MINQYFNYFRLDDTILSLANVLGSRFVDGIRPRVAA